MPIMCQIWFWLEAEAIKTLIQSQLSRNREENKQLKIVDMCHEKAAHRANGNQMDWPLNPGVRELQTSYPKRVIAKYHERRTAGRTAEVSNGNLLQVQDKTHPKACQEMNHITYTTYDSIYRYMIVEKESLHYIQRVSENKWASPDWK